MCIYSHQGAVFSTFINNQTDSPPPPSLFVCEDMQSLCVYILFYHWLQVELMLYEESVLG